MREALVDGTHLKPGLVYHAWARRVARLGPVGSAGERPTFHDLRHTFGTAMAYAGCPESSLKSIMGHGSIDTTHKYYVGVDSDADSRAMAATMLVMHGRDDNVIEFPRTGTEG